MFNLKKYALGLLLLISFQLFSNTLLQTSSSFFVADTYEEKGIKINYSAVINAVLIDNFNGNKKLSLQLSSFLIEDAKYNNRIYRENDIFGISFPIDTAVEITAKIQLLYGVKLLNKTIILHPNKKTTLDLNTKEISFSEIQLNNKKTLAIKALHSHETFIGDIKTRIEQNSHRKDSEAIEDEHTRLMILGNNYLNENNYKKAVSTYQYAKKYTTDISYAESQIFTTSKYAQRYNIIIDTEYKPHNTVSKDFYTKKQPSIFKKNTPKKNETKVGKLQNKQTKQVKNEDGSEYVYPAKNNNNAPVYAVNYDDPDASEFEYEYETTTPLKIITIFDEENTEFEYDYEDGKPTNFYTNSVNEAEYETEYETEDGKPIVLNNSQPITSNKGIQSSTNRKSSGIKAITRPEKSKIKKIVSNQPQQETVIDVQKPSEENFEIIRTKKGYIKYRKDEQAVVDREGNILIPYGKHEIIRFRAGFARIKIKDDVEIKNIVCQNKNVEYNWSARIYENPWKETVIDKSGSFVDKVVKKVEIYIVDNVNNISNSELSPDLLKIYKDPNPFKGSDQISAHNLWNRENSNKPSVIEKRAEIERLKKITKEDSFRGAEECRTQISKHFEEVYAYYHEMGYEIILKD